MFAHVSIWGVLVGALSAMVIGMLWYSEPMFGKPWMKAIGLTDKEMKKKMGPAMPILIVAALLTSYVLSQFIVYYHSYAHSSWLSASLHVSLLAWFGIGLTSIFAHGVFEPRDRKVLYINAGNRLATLVAMGLIIGAFMK